MDRGGEIREVLPHLSEPLSWESGMSHGDPEVRDTEPPRSNGGEDAISITPCTRGARRRLSGVLLCPRVRIRAGKAGRQTHGG